MLYKAYKEYDEPEKRNDLMAVIKKKSKNKGNDEEWNNVNEIESNVV